MGSRPVQHSHGPCLLPKKGVPDVTEARGDGDGEGELEGEREPETEREGDIVPPRPYCRSACAAATGMLPSM